jgi:hypothetical protein
MEQEDKVVIETLRGGEFPLYNLTCMDVNH